MASINDLICEALRFPEFIVTKQETLETIGKDRHFAALNIQKFYRGYKVRSEICKWNRAATVLQKYIRRWLVLWNLPNFYQEYCDWYGTWIYNKMATRIQALWRGYWVRKDQIPPREVLRRRLEIAALNEETQKSMKDSFLSSETEKMKQMDIEAEKWVLFILFKLHHHLRTYNLEGIYSTHNSKQLSPIEELFKVLPLSEYMSELKKCYYKEIAKEAPRPGYMYKAQIMRNLEDAYRNRDRSNELKKVVEREVHTQKKPFVRTPFPKKKPYEKMLYNAETYTTPRMSFARTVDPSKNICNKKFDLHVHKKAIVKEHPPPYYLDHWVKTCQEHNIPD
ncbi:hypothetical protein RN001_015229 [Aquatica leii]|uniref:Spermatogenesis-associated protein 17 n=1 Tax=Aquatica leii TaxID=1421715 RepID=A0AAN7PZ62_9COLE|nr:hypothetical protein RN001_015229 [Aquatica leii]